MPLRSTPPSPLYVLTGRAAAREQNGDPGLCATVHPFVEHMGHYQTGIIAIAEALQNRMAFLNWGLMGDSGNQQSFGDAVDRGVVVGEDDGAFGMGAGPADPPVFGVLPSVPRAMVLAS